MASLHAVLSPDPAATERREEFIVDCLLLLSRWQADALHAAAADANCTVGQLLRRLIDDFTQKRRNP